MLGVHGLRSDQDLVRLVEERLATGAIERLLQSGLTGGEIFSLIMPRRTLTHRRARHEACMHNFGLCCWRLGRFEEPERVFDRMLWLNPSDHQGVRFLIGPVRERRAWEEWRDKR